MTKELEFKDALNVLAKRELRLVELEKQIEIDSEYIIALQKQNGELTDKARELEAQIEKMKCCYNCSKWYDGECEESPKSKTFFCADFKCDNWELAD